MSFLVVTQNALQNYKKKSIYASTKCMPPYFFCHFGINYLHMSKKSSTFAAKIE